MSAKTKEQLKKEANDLLRTISNKRGIQHLSNAQLKLIASHADGVDALGSRETRGDEIAFIGHPISICTSLLVGDTVFLCPKNKVGVEEYRAGKFIFRSRSCRWNPHDDDDLYSRQLVLFEDADGNVVTTATHDWLVSIDDLEVQ